jgi:alkylation response protein AidB-like acyl-CoA dehydrogenase/aminoglycoside phosphotransferase (APT) family kinase protein
MIALCEDVDVLGTPFYLMTFVPGHIFIAPGLPALPSPEHRAAVYDEMAAVLGAIHRVDPAAVGLAGYGKPDNYSHRQLERWARQYHASVTTPEAPVVALIQWLRAHVPAEEPSGRLVHGDFRLDNLVFASPSGPLGGGGVTAVLDWELSTLGAPYSDIAYNCMPYHLPPGGEAAAYPSFTSADLPPGVPSEREYVAKWARASGLPNPMLSGGSCWPFYVALSLFRGAAILAGVRARAVAGNAAAANASAAGQVVEILAARALVVAGVTPNGVPHSLGPAGSTMAARAGARVGAGGVGRSVADAGGLIMARTSASTSSTFVPAAAASSSAGFEPSARAGALLVKLRRFMCDHVYAAETILEAHAATPERWSVCPKVEELKALAKSAGLWNLWLPADSRELLKLSIPNGEDGKLLTGPGLTNLEYAHLAGEMGASVWASELFNCSAPDTGNMEVLLRYGTERQQRQWLAPLLRGEIRSCFAMTEPEVASSDATNIRSSIVVDGDDFLVNGLKWWTSGACDPRCRLAIFMGKTSPDAPKHRQQSMVLVPMDAPGVTVVRHLPVFGYDDAPHGHAETLFENVRVPAVDSMLLGEGRGFEIAQGRLGPGRLHHCMRLIGMGERALQLAARRASSRVAFGKTLAENGSVLQTLGRSRVMLDGARLATLDAARRLDLEGNKVAKGAIAACKVAAPAAALSVIDAAIQIHGGMGVSDDTPLARMYAGARTLRLADGPDEVHLETIARLELRRAKL